MKRIAEIRQKRSSKFIENRLKGKKARPRNTAQALLPTHISHWPRLVLTRRFAPPPLQSIEKAAARKEIERDINLIRVPKIGVEESEPLAEKLKVRFSAPEGREEGRETRGDSSACARRLLSIRRPRAGAGDGAHAALDARSGSLQRRRGMRRRRAAGARRARGGRRMTRNGAHAVAGRGGGADLRMPSSGRLRIA